MTDSEKTHRRYYHTKRPKPPTQIAAVTLSEDTFCNLGFKSQSMAASDDVPFVDQIFVFISGRSTKKKPEFWLTKVIEVDLETK